MKLDLGPRDLCPLGHGPMWYWPTGGTWACQLPSCEIAEPVTQVEVDRRAQWQRDYLRFDHSLDALRYSMNVAAWARPPLVMPPAGLFRIVSTS